MLPNKKYCFEGCYESCFYLFGRRVSGYHLLSQWACDGNIWHYFTAWATVVSDLPNVVKMLIQAPLAQILCPWCLWPFSYFRIFLLSLLWPRLLQPGSFDSQWFHQVYTSHFWRLSSIAFIVILLINYASNKVSKKTIIWFDEFFKIYSITLPNKGPWNRGCITFVFKVSNCNCSNICNYPTYNR